MYYLSLIQFLSDDLEFNQQSSSQRFESIGLPLHKKSNLIEGLEQKYQLLNVFFDSLKELTEKEKNTKTEAKRFSFLETIQIYLSLLRLILSNSSLILNSQHVDILWESLINQDYNQQAKIVTFEWLSDNQASLSSYFQDAAFEYLFVEKMIKMKSEDLSQYGYDLFERSFLYLNEKQGKVKKLDKKSANLSFEYVATSSGLTGVETLWDFILGNSTSNSTHIENAMNVLNSLHQYVSSESLKGKYLKTREEYLAVCMQHLQASLAKPNCCILLLKKYLTEFNEQYSTRNTNLKQTPSQYILFAQYDSAIYSIPISSTDLIKTLKEKISKESGHPTSSWIMTNHSGNEYRDDNLTIHEASLKDFQYVYVYRRAKLKKEDEDLGPVNVPVETFLIKSLTFFARGLGVGNLIPNVDSSRTSEHSEQLKTLKEGSPKGHPARILASDEYFLHFYDLLSDPNAKVAQNGWELLDLLPTNSASLGRIKHCYEKEIEWKQFLGTDYKLLYNLQVINLLLQSKIDPTFDKETWSQNFIQTKGLDHLIETFLHLSTEGIKQLSFRFFKTVDFFY